MIVLFPNPILRQKAESVTKFDKSLHDIVKKMEKIMLSQKHGIGIAAPQIGIAKQVAIVDLSRRIKTAKPIVLINPKVIKCKDEIINREGCMSIPEYTAHIKRFNWVACRYQDLSGEWIDYETSGIEAICIQHEVDHLNARLFIDHVTSMMRDLIPRPKDFRSSKER